MARKIAFLDDSRSILKTISFSIQELEDNGTIKFKTYDDSEKFAKKLKKGKLDFDILFLDINMPGFSGFDIVELIRSLDAYKSKVVIALTTEFSAESKQRGKEAGFNGWITKISSPEIMKTTIVNTIKALEKKGL